MSAPLFLVTVDTEEDNWGEYACRHPTVENLRELPTFQTLCERYGIRPTYLVNYPVVTSDLGRGILDELRARKAGFGAHCHPWNTPPVEEQVGPYASFLSNLPATLVQQKLHRLTEAITLAAGERPTCFRAGRWGVGPGVTTALHALGYRIDSSVSPFVDWSAEGGPDHSAHPRTAYRFHPETPFRPDPTGPMVQIPATIGFWQRDQDRAMARLRLARRVPRVLRAVGMADRLRWATLRWLSPETASGKDMVRLARTLLQQGARYLNLTFHSTTLLPGRTPFVATAADRVRFVERLARIFEFVQEADLRPATLESGETALASSIGLAGQTTRDTRGHPQ